MSPPIERPLVIDSTGRIVLPSEVRRRLNLRAGSRLRLDIVAERIELTPEPEAEPELRASATKRMVLRPTGRAFALLIPPAVCVTLVACARIDEDYAH